MTFLAALMLVVAAATFLAPFCHAISIGGDARPVRREIPEWGIATLAIVCAVLAIPLRGSAAGELLFLAALCYVLEACFAWRRC